MAEGEVIHAGKNTKVSVLSQRLIEWFLEQGWIELEAVGAEAVNQAVKAVAKARQALEIEGYSLVIIPKLVEVPLGHDSGWYGDPQVVRLGYTAACLRYGLGVVVPLLSLALTENRHAGHQKRTGHSVEETADRWAAVLRFVLDRIEEACQLMKVGFLPGDKRL